MNRSILLLVTYFCLSFTLTFAQEVAKPKYKDASLPVEERINDLLPRLTLEEKIQLLSGDSTYLNTRPNKGLGIPAFHMSDGPLGVRFLPSTAFPSGALMASTWNPELVGKVTQAMGMECKARGKNVLLGPCVSIHRTPKGGRNYESFGEDPFLSGNISSAYVKGLQSEHVVACVKHFVGNEQEAGRNSKDSKISERALHEIYMAPFKTAVQDGKAWSVMSGYNRVNGQYCSDNTDLLTNTLKNQWGFKGVVISDWGGTYNLVSSLYAGLDLEMGYTKFYTVEDIAKVLRNGEIKVQTIDDKVRRILRVMFSMGFFENEFADAGALDTPEIQKVNRECAQSGMVLLKNENNILPVNAKKVKRIALIGPGATVCRYGNWGSSLVNPTYMVSPLEAFSNKAKGKFTITSAQGVNIANDFFLYPIPVKYLKHKDGKSLKPGLIQECFNNPNLEGTPVLKRIDNEVFYHHWFYLSPFKEITEQYYSIRWTGVLVPPKTAKYVINADCDQSGKLYLNDKLVSDRRMWLETDTISLEAGKEYDFRFEFRKTGTTVRMCLNWQILDTEMQQEAIDVAKQADLVLYFASVQEGESSDRDELKLESGQDELIQKIAGVNKNTAVILHTGSPVDMRNWYDKVPVIVQAYYTGQEGGNAIADVLLGNVNPSGKTIDTYFKNPEDILALDGFPGNDLEIEYKEGIWVGYRDFDRRNIEPYFPFGYGLSYTTFELSDLNTSAEKIKQGMPIDLSLKIKNKGKVAGAEVVQVYVQDIEPSLERPVKELKGFQKVFLQAGEEKEITIKLSPETLKFYDVCSKSWIAEPGKFKAHVGTSSRDIKLTAEFELE